MLIEFDKIDKSILPNFKGGEGELIANMFTDDNNKILFGRLTPASSIGIHTHDDGSEIIYILKGNGCVLFDDTREIIAEGSCHYCPMGHSHSLINDSNSDLVFIAVVPNH